MLRFPDVSAEHIVFVYAGDIWTVPRSGGLARRLSSPRGHESFPKFSPDGTRIAFSGNYDGNTDVYVMPSRGGAPVRLTHHSAKDTVVDWYPDGGSILYRSKMFSPSTRYNQFFRQPVEGGLPEQLPFPYGELASFSPDASKIAFQTISREFRTWKRYRGGMASDIWIYDFEDNASGKITKFTGTDAVPMWHKNTVYFISDRDGNKKLNIWACDIKNGNTRQITRFTEYDVKWPSIGPDAIVFENGGKLHLLDLDSAESRPVHITVPADLPHFRPALKNVSDQIENFTISPTGKRALFEARGEVFTVPAKHGSIRNLTKTSGIAERFPVWSPDAAHVAYFSDRTGEYELYTRSITGDRAEKQITEGSAAYRYSPVWSPDSTKIAFTDKTGSLYYVEIADGSPHFVDKDQWTRLKYYSWSPDSRWITYSRTAENRHGSIMIYDTTQKRTHQVTGNFYNDAEPVFDRSGKYLFFRSNRSFAPVYGDLDLTWIYPDSTALYAAVLTVDGESPLSPRSDEEDVEPEYAEEDQTAENSDSDDTSPDNNGASEPDSNAVEIDFDGLEQRIVKIPVDAGDISSLSTAKGKLLYLRKPPAGRNGDATLVYYDLDDREEKTVMASVTAYSVSADGRKFVYRSGSDYGISSVAANKSNGTGKIDADELTAWISPRAEWRQIFNEVWRIQRDFFYDPNMHGVDWKAVKQRYEALLPHVVDREDLNYVMGEMIAELNASHAYVRGGDIEKPEKISVGLLGCDFVLDPENKLYQISRIYQGPTHESDDRSPLLRPGLDIRQGDYILAVNGSELDTSKDPWAAFQGLAGKVVTLTVASLPDRSDATDVLVEPISSEFRVRHLAWIQSNRLKVRQATSNRVGYIYVPNTGRKGQSELVRQFSAQWHKKALIIDERFNSGGQIPDRFIELLDRPIFNYWARRDHRDWRTPFIAHTGPKVMLANGWSGSGGDAFPYYFRKAGLGPIVGTRTWGGLIGISGNPQPIDGGYVSAPTFGFWNTRGKWEVEGYGVDPDYEVENAPHEMVAGRDPQLKKAVEVILDLLESQSDSTPPKPDYPDRSD